jgi:hypothetical protein
MKQARPKVQTPKPASKGDQGKPLTPTSPKKIPLQDLIAYRARNLTYAEIASLTGCSKQNVSERLQEIDLDSLPNLQAHKDKVLEAIQGQIIQNIDLREIKNAPFGTKMLGIGLLQDKIQTLRGQATEIIDHRHLVVDLARVCELVRRQSGGNPGSEASSTTDIEVQVCPPSSK